MKVTANASSGRGAVRLANVTADELAKYINGLNASNTASQYALAAFSAATHRVARAQATLVDAQRAVAALPTDERERGARVGAGGLRGRGASAVRREGALHIAPVRPAAEPRAAPPRHRCDGRPQVEARALWLCRLPRRCARGLRARAGGRALDTRLRDGVELADELGLPLLAEVPRFRGGSTAGASS